MDASVIADQRARYGETNTMMPYLAQTSSGDYVPDYTEDRYNPKLVAKKLHENPKIVDEADYFSEA
jgi:hypothetical protein